MTEATAIALQAGYMFLETEVPGGNVPSKYISNHPIHKVNSSLTLSHGPIEFQATAEYIERNAEEIESIGGRIEDSYLLVHFSTAFSLNENLALYVKMRNSLDQDYQEILGAQMPGRWTMVGIKINLNQGLD